MTAGGILGLAMTIRGADAADPILWANPQTHHGLANAVGETHSQANAPGLTAYPGYVNTFRALDFVDNFDGFDSEHWDKGAHRLGRGYLDPNNVSIDGGALTLRFPAKKYDGAEIVSKERYSYGDYTVRMMCPNAPGSISAFFLYQEDARGRADEVDVEIYNDGGRRRMELTTWVKGQRTNYAWHSLAFDPTAAYHEYRISFNQRWVSFYVDWRHVQKWISRLPANSMRVMANAWWPTWVSGPKPKTDSYTRIDSVQYSASST